MTVEETRKILGKEVQDLTDKQIQDMIIEAQNICEVFLNNFIRCYKDKIQKL